MILSSTLRDYARIFRVRNESARPWVARRIGLLSLLLTGVLAHCHSAHALILELILPAKSIIRVAYKCLAYESCVTSFCSVWLEKAWLERETALLRWENLFWLSNTMCFFHKWWLNLRRFDKSCFWFLWCNWVKFHESRRGLRVNFYILLLHCRLSFSLQAFS